MNYNENINITQFCLEYYPSFGGQATTVNDFYKTLGGRIISFITPKKQDLISSENNDVKYVYTSEGIIGRKYSYINIKKRKSIIGSISDSEIIICHGLFRHHTQVSFNFAQLLDIPFIIIPHGSLDPWTFSYRRQQKILWMNTIGKKILKKSNCILFATQNEKIKASRYIRNCSNTIINWPVEKISFSNEQSNKARIRRLLNIPLDSKLLLYIGRLHPMKQPIETLNLLSKINIPNLYLLVMGPDDILSKSQINAEAKKFKFKNLRTIDPVFGPEKYNYFRAADAHILLSHRENFGYTVAESLACGTPVIISPGVDLGSELLPHNCGWILSDNYESTIINAINQFIQADPKLLAELGKNGQDWVNEYLSYEKFKSNIYNLINNILIK